MKWSEYLRRYEGRNYDPPETSTPQLSDEGCDRWTESSLVTMHQASFEWLF
jgi:hypothetical protein